jgi:hypothetical protein
VTFPQSNVVGSQIEADVKVSGCDSVSSAELYDNNRLIRTFSMDTNPEPVILQTQDISFGVDGIAAQLSLTAQIVCSDGRTAKSSASGAQFLPVAQVLNTTDGSYFVPRFFFADGSGDQATFVGCAIDPIDSIPKLMRVNQVGKVIAKQDRTDITCDDTAVFTDPGAGYRWMLIRGIGAIAFDVNLTVTSVARGPWSESGSDGANVTGNSIAINPDDGNAIIWELPNESKSNSTLYRVRPDCINSACPAIPNAPPPKSAVPSSGTLSLPILARTRIRTNCWQTRWSQAALCWSLATTTTSAQVVTRASRTSWQ